MVAFPQIRCQLHDHARQYDNDDACHDKWNGGKLHVNISRNGYGNAHRLMLMRGVGIAMQRMH